MTASGPRAYTAVVNPVAGSGQAYERWVPLAARLSAAGAEVRVELSRSGRHATELAAEAAAARRVVVAVGGDGLVRDVAGGVVPAAGTMAIVPAGRGNDLAHRLGLPTGVDALFALLRDGSTRALDVIEARATAPAPGNPGAGGTTVLVPGNVYAGVDSAANAIVNASHLPGWLAYRLAPLRAVVTWRPPHYALTTDGRTRAVIAHTVVVANSGAYGHGLAIVPSAEPDDGQLHVLVVGPGSRWKIGTFLLQARRGTHVTRPEVDISTARQVRIAANRDVPVYADGDEIGHLPVTIRLRPGALRLLVAAT